MFNKKYIVTFLLAVAFLSTAAADSKLTVKTYPLKWVRASELLETVNSLIGDKGKAFTIKTGNEFIISTTDDLHAQIKQLIKDLDRPRPNVQINVTMNETGHTTDRGVALKGNGKVVVTGKGAKTHYKFTSEARNRTTKISSNTKQILLVQSGREGQLHIGEEIPYADWLFYYGRSHGYIDQDFVFDMQRTGVFLTASPTVIGNGPLISITLTPEIRTLIGKKHKRFRFTRVATTVTAQNGQPMKIGGSAQNREFYEKFLTGFSSNGSIKSLNITLTPFIKYPDGR